MNAGNEQRWIQLDIVSAQSHIDSRQVASISVSAINGQMGIMPGHSPLLSPLKPGPIEAMMPDGQVLDIYVSGGTIEVQPYHVTILADTAIRAADLDETAVQAAMNEARQVLSSPSAGQMDTSQALGQLAEMAAQLRMIRRRANRH